MRYALLKLLIAVSAAALMSTSAQTADLPGLPVEPPVPADPPAYVPAYDWNGMYVGLHAGYGWGDSDSSGEAWKKNKRGKDDNGDGDAGGCGGCNPKPLIAACHDGFCGEKSGDSRSRRRTFDESIDSDGFLAGGQIGYNHQIGNFVLGLEADLSWSGMDGEVDLFERDGRVSSLSHDLEWLATVRGRAGVTLDRFLVYATGGVAFAEVESGFKNERVDFSDSSTRVGWTVGAGVEAFITPNVTAKVEYLYVDLGEDDLNFSGDHGLEINGESDFSTHIVRGGLNYKFTW